MKAITRIILLLAVLLIAAALVKDRLVKAAAQRLIKEETGFALDVRKVHVGLLRPVIEIADLRLNNPSDFPEGVALQVDRVFLHYRPLSLFSREIRITEADLRIPRIVVVRKQDGETNLQRLAGKSEPSGRKRRLPETAREPAPVPQAEPDHRPSREMRIDTLRVALGEVELLDYQRGGAHPSAMKLRLDIDRTYHNITDFRNVGALIAAEITANALPQLLGQDLDATRRQLEQARKSLNKSFSKKDREALEKTARKLRKGFKSLLDR